MLRDIVWDTPIMLAFAPFAAMAIGIVSFFIYKMWKVSADNALKQSMVERGMSVDEIERVIRCGNESELSPLKQLKPNRPS